MQKITVENIKKLGKEAIEVGYHSVTTLLKIIFTVACYISFAGILHGTRKSPSH